MPLPLTSPAFGIAANGPHGVPARLYFRVKPFIPQPMRFFLRRMRVPRIMRRSADIWPIDPQAGEAPADWPGWPFGKKFGLVFTHDVESSEGQAKTKDLAELEMAHGFRSSFNFIPEGPYNDSPALREWLVENGFEVGVHDLRHDGSLFARKERFQKDAKRINHYLHQWGAVGFRSGLMLRRLDWLHELDLLYDTSTFDTDPFELQPEGTRTIFPFHVKPPEGVERPGYVELSYSLPQDSTLFLLLKEKTAGIWKRKLDWIARHGGLALVNIHPDYVDFSGSGDSGSVYPASLLEDFLMHIRTEYHGMYWNPVARDLATWFREPTNPLAEPPVSDSPLTLDSINS